MKKFTIPVLALIIISGCQIRHYIDENTKISNQSIKKDEKETNNDHNLDDQKTSKDIAPANEKQSNLKKPDEIKQSNTEIQQKPPSSEKESDIAVNEEPSDSTKKPVEKPVENKDDSIQVVAQPNSIPVLVNKSLSLPENFVPKNLVYLDVPFIFLGKSEKRMMRKEAATALEQLFAGAKEEGVTLLGVSAYRSYQTQKALFERYVSIDGYEKARTYSAIPGTSEHQTGLAIDVTGGNGKCAAEDCFAGTVEAAWLEQNAAEYGFIIRYPKGKDKITGYKYEPWHLRYVGKDVAIDVAAKGITLEEYFNTLPVSN
ncbi:D-alanyl-D-alanine carboxypeptidase family protein [Neobacillus niacini]|uniref:M15 family metallopeptidase n=1 Tax=Neobacillus niacini TaxID=86668 RepID=UPI0039833F5E